LSLPRGIVDAVVEFRSAVKRAVLAGVKSSSHDATLRKQFVDVMSLCDDLRDVKLMDVGVKVVDTPTGSVWTAA
jgi:cysteinyl-tRNA synthetase